MDPFPDDPFQCGDTDGDGCDDCSSGGFDPANDCGGPGGGGDSGCCDTGGTGDPRALILAVFVGAMLLRPRRRRGQ
jgi:hypothetical protein